MPRDLPLHVDCHAMDQGWRCTVTVGDDRASTTHTVTVSTADLARYASGDLEPAALVRASFEFLLRREDRSSILGSFELPVIARYFPDYPEAMAAVFPRRP